MEAMELKLIEFKIWSKRGFDRFEETLFSIFLFWVRVIEDKGTKDKWSVLTPKLPATKSIFPVAKPKVEH